MKCPSRDSTFIWVVSLIMETGSLIKLGASSSSEVVLRPGSFFKALLCIAKDGHVCRFIRRDPINPGFCLQDNIPPTSHDMSP